MADGAAEPRAKGREPRSRRASLPVGEVRPRPDEPAQAWHGNFVQRLSVTEWNLPPRLRGGRGAAPRPAGLPRLFTPSIAHQRQDLAAATLVFAEGAHHPARGHHHAWGRHSACGHAGMTRLDYHGDTLWLEMVPNGVSDLRRQALL